MVNEGCRARVMVRMRERSEGEAKGESKRPAGRTAFAPAMKKLLIRLRCSNTAGPNNR